MSSQFTYKMRREMAKGQDTQLLILVDSVYKICGFMSKRDLDLYISEPLQITGGVAKLERRLTSERRKRLLVLSRLSTAISQDQLQVIKTELRFLSKSHELGMAQTLQPSGDLRLVTRDERGLFLGVFSLQEARQRYPHVTKTGWVLCTNTTVSLVDGLYAPTDDSANRVPSVGRSQRTLASIALARDYAKTLATESGDAPWAVSGSDSAEIYDIYLDDNEPFWHATLSDVERVFRSDWFLFDNGCVQLVVSWDLDVIEEHIRSVKTEASRQTVSSPSINPSLNDTLQAPKLSETPSKSDVTTARKTNEKKDKNKAANTKHKGDGKTSSWTTGSVTRDKNGCFLGVFTIEQAWQLWPDAYARGSMVVVPRTIEFKEAQDALSHVQDYTTTFRQRRYRQSVGEARHFAASHANRSTTTYWTFMVDTPLKVYNNLDRPIGTASPRALQRVFGDAWFLVSDAEAQIMTTWSAGVVRSRLDGAQRATAASELNAESDIGPGRQAILAVSGSILYDCDEASFDLVYRQMLRDLPLGSYVVLPRGIRLTKSLEELRLGSPADFRSRCQAIVDHTGDADANGRPATTERISPKGRRITKASARNDKLTFEGPTNVLHVFKGTIACRRRGHNVEAATGYVSSVGGRQFMINTNWCQNCGMYFIGYSEYMHYRERYGPILGNFDFKGFAISGSSDGYAGYAKESPLMLCGYNVNKSAGLSAKERHLILANIMDRHILSKPRVMEYLSSFIRDRKHRPNMQEACEKWEADLEWVRRYRIESQRSFTVAEIRRFR